MHAARPLVADAQAQPAKLGVRIPNFRPDIEGLRAIAVLSVLVYHLRSDWLPGGYIGVDIFFVISGFLITSHLVREHDKSGRISLVRFYSRRMVRLIPAATVVLIATAAGTVLFVPRILWQQIGIDIAASATYVINWVLASRSVDYLAEDSIVSPLQHFWSLAVEEQFYVIWPLLIIVAAVVAARLALPKRRTLVAAGLIVFGLSLAAALFTQATGDVTAYFATTTRLWELAAGGIAALTFDSVRRRIPHGVLRAGFWFGLAAVVFSIVFIGDQNQWPGSLTVVPIVGASLMVLTGGLAIRSLGERLVSIKPLVWVGGISYSLYLWHWPIIVLAGYVIDRMGLIHYAAIAVASVALAWGSNKLIENPIRFSRWARGRARNGLILGIACGALSVIIAVGLIAAAPGAGLKAPDGAVAQGATVLSDPVDSTPGSVFVAQPDWVLPSPIEAPEDVPQLYADGCQQNQQSSEVLQCEYGDVASTDSIAVVGDSKAAQWVPALAAIADKHGLKLVVMTKSACAFADATSIIDGGAYASCDEWNRGVHDALKELKPELVVTSTVQEFAWTDGNGATRSVEGVGVMKDGLVNAIEQVRSSGSKVAIIGDTPEPPSPVYQCVAEHSDDVSQCAFDRERGIAESALPTQRAAAADLGATVANADDETESGSDSGTALIDLTGYICPDQVADACPPIIGNSLVYRQGSHITATYVATMGDGIEKQLVNAGMLSPAQ